MNGFTNARSGSLKPEGLAIEKFPISLVEYQRKFERVIAHLEYGDSFLTNLTVKTEIDLNLVVEGDFFS